jgi:hypothetical protein
VAAITIGSEVNILDIEYIAGIAGQGAAPWEDGKIPITPIIFLSDEYDSHTVARSTRRY